MINPVFVHQCMLSVQGEGNVSLYSLRLQNKKNFFQRVKPEEFYSHLDLISEKDP